MAIDLSDPLDISVDGNKLVRTAPPADDFIHREGSEPHATRRKKILSERPDIVELYGYDSSQALFCLGTMAVTMVTAYVVKDWSWLPFLLASYIVSGTMNHSLMLALHELSHDNFFPHRMQNVWFSFLANLPIGVPMANTFRRYHMIHHTSLGTHMADMDLPSKLEAVVFQSAPGRLLWLFLQPFFYGFRPVLLKPLPVTRWEVVNLLAQLAFDAAVWHFWGTGALLYFLLGTLLGTGVHPMSGHFFEHLETVSGQETYSYYGPLNWLSYNVGYHNEHHDFPSVPGSRLPQLKSRASAHYALPHYSSWPKVIWDFVVKGNANLYCRVIRQA